MQNNRRMAIMKCDDDRCLLKERRKRPTPGLSWYTFFGRRKALTRMSDYGKGGYVDRYSAKLFAVLIIILGLNVLDVILTMVILEHQGYELIRWSAQLLKFTEINSGCGNMVSSPLACFSCVFISNSRE